MSCGLLVLGAWAAWATLLHSQQMIQIIFKSASMAVKTSHEVMAYDKDIVLENPLPHSFYGDNFHRILSMGMIY